MTRNKISNINANIFNAKPCVRGCLQRYHRDTISNISWVFVRNMGGRLFFNFYVGVSVLYICLLL